MLGLGLDYYQKREVEQIVDEQLRIKLLGDAFRNLLNKITIEAEIKAMANTVVPEVCSRWFENNQSRIDSRVNARVDIRMRDKFLPYFRQEISENRDVTGFIHTHLQEVERRVREVADKAVEQVVSNSNGYQPIFNAQMNILSQKNASLITSQMTDINSTKRLLENSLAKNDEFAKNHKELTNKVESLERSNSRLTAFTLVTAIASACVLAK